VRPILLTFLALILDSTTATMDAEPARATPAPRPPDRERWYRLTLGGADAGWTHEAADSIDGLREWSESLLRVERLNTEIRLWSRTEARRDSKGRVTTQFSASSAPGETLRIDASYDSDSLRLLRREGGLTTRLAYPSGSLDPFTIESRYDSAAAQPGREIRFRAFWPELERELIIGLVAEASDTLRLMDGSREPARRFRLWPVELAAAGTLEWRDKRGALLRSEEETLGLVAELSTREICLRASTPVDLMRRTFVSLDRSFGAETRYGTIRYRLTHTRGSVDALRFLPPARAIARDPESITLEVTDAEAARANDPPTPACLASTALLQANDPSLLAVARRESGAGDALTRATRLCRYVARHIKRKDLAIGFGSALSTLESGEGDCTEHAVLLAALCRAVGLPSRLKAGLLALGSSMGYHLWTEVWDGSAWVGLDATFDRVPVDGRYLAITASDLGAGRAADLAEGILPWIGQVEIQVLSVGP